MKILVFGAGVIGTIIAAKLHEAGVDTRLLARGKRFERLQQNGVVIHNVMGKTRSVSKIPFTNRLNPDDFYDLIIVTVRLDQLPSAIETLKQDKQTPALMFMLNNPDNLEALPQEFPDKKIILGFPGAGGTYRNNEIDYIQLKQQKTTLGDFDGEISLLTQRIKEVLEKAGIQSELNTQMQDWLKTHAIFVACVAASISKENGDSVRLGKNKQSVQQLVKSINEGFKAIQQLGLPITPANLKTIFMTMPQWFSVMYWRKALQGEMGTLAFAPHVKAAKPEMQLLAQKVLKMVHSSSVETPTLDKLLGEFIGKA